MHSVRLQIFKLRYWQWAIAVNGKRYFGGFKNKSWEDACNNGFIALRKYCAACIKIS